MDLAEIVEMSRGATHLGGELEELFEIEFDDYEKLLHEYIPNKIREMCRKHGYTCTIYHLKDDVSLPEYIVIVDDAVAVELHVDHECPEIGSCVARVYVGASYPRNLLAAGALAYYHEV